MVISYYIYFLWHLFRDGKCFFVLFYHVFHKVLNIVFSIFHWKWFVSNLSPHLYDTTVLDFEFLPSFFIFKSSCIFFLDPLWHSILTSFICCFLRVWNVKDTGWKMFFLCAALWTVWASSKDLWVYQPWRKEKWKCQSLSCVWPFATSWTVAHQAPLSMEFSRQEYWSG